MIRLIVLSNSLNDAGWFERTTTRLGSGLRPQMSGSTAGFAVATEVRMPLCSWWITFHIVLCSCSIESWRALRSLPSSPSWAKRFRLPSSTWVIIRIRAAWLRASMWLTILLSSAHSLLKVSESFLVVIRRSSLPEVQPSDSSMAYGSLLGSSDCEGGAMPLRRSEGDGLNKESGAHWMYANLPRRRESDAAEPQGGGRGTTLKRLEQALAFACPGHAPQLSPEDLQLTVA